MEELQELLSSIQRQLKAPKNQFNSFGNYHYRNCEDIIEAVKPLLPDGATLCIQDSIEFVGARYYVKATATLDYKGRAIHCDGYAREPESRKGMDESQITGATSSYARKYALNGLFLIDDTKDADSKDNSAVHTTPKVPFVFGAKKPENGPVTQLPPAAVAPPQAQDSSGPSAFVIPYGYSKGKTVDQLTDKNLDYYLNAYLNKIQNDPNNTRFRPEWEEAVMALQAEKDARRGYHQEEVYDEPMPTL